MKAKSADAAARVRIQVNGTEHEVSAAADTPLLYVLRNQLGLKAAHFGCGSGQCGAWCAVIAGIEAGREIRVLRLVHWRAERPGGRFPRVVPIAALAVFAVVAVDYPALLHNVHSLTEFLRLH